MNEIEIQAWNEFARDLRKRVRWDVEKIERALTGALEFLPVLESQERADLLRMGKVVAERSSKLALTFLRSAPQAASSIQSPFRPVWIRWGIGLAEHSRETLIDFLEKSPEILGALPEGDILFFLHYGLKLAARDPSVSYKYFTNLPRIQMEVEKDRFPLWFEEGLSLIAKNLSEALAYFGLESKRSRDRGQENGTSVSLGEVSRPLKLFAQALTGRGLGLRSLQEPEVGFRHPLGILPCTDGETIFLPEVMRHFSTSNLNFLAFKLATAHQAGYVEFGTFTFQLSSIQDVFPAEYIRACLRGISEKGKEISSLEAFFHLFPKKNLAQDLFRLLEGGRVDHCLRREYRGLKGEIELFLQTAMEDRPAVGSLPLQEALLEAILRFTILGGPVTAFPWPTLRYQEDLLSLLAPLLCAGATANDSARATVILYRWLSALPNIRWTQIPSDSNKEILPLMTQPILQPGGMESIHRAPQGEEPYKGLAPLPHWGELRPELVQKKIRIREVRNLLHQMEMGIPLSPEALKALLEKGIEWDLEISDGQDEEAFQGLFVTDLKGLKKPRAVQEAARRAKEKLKGELRALLEEVGEEGGIHFFYDEWDYQISDYRVKWCRLKEKEAESGSTEFVDRTLECHSDLVAEVRKQFQMLKPERFKKIPHLERGEEIDLNAAIEASIDRRAGRSPSEKIYVEKNRKDRDFSTLFLLDMSASTDEWIEGKGEDKKIIDIEKEALVVMAVALEEIGDEYAIFGFSGYGRKEVDFYSIKNFRESYGDQVKGRIEKIKPHRSTRMGPAIRHAVEKMADRDSKVKNLILISDGYPQDYDYGDDRSDKEYALQDTTIALEEAARKNIHTFCITVDRAGHDYLRKMMPPSRYLIIEETAALPQELPKIYRRLTT